MQPLALEFIDQTWAGRVVRVAINADRTDRYLDRVRAGGGHQSIADLLLSLTAEGDSVIDAGANVGMVTLPLAVEGRRVLAIEAMAENYVALLTSVAANNLGLATPVHAAVAAAPSLLDIEGSSAFARVKISDQPGATPGATLDQLTTVYGFDEAVVLKLDVEGSEMDALDGADTLLRSPGLRAVVYEANGAHCTRVGYRPSALAARLAEYGFVVHMIAGSTLVPATSLAFQPLGNTDYLAVRPDGRVPARFTVGALAAKAEQQGIVEALENANRGYRAFMVGELSHAPAEVCAQSAVRSALASVVSDDASADPVRSAAQDLLV